MPRLPRLGQAPLPTGPAPARLPFAVPGQELEAAGVERLAGTLGSISAQQGQIADQLRREQQTNEAIGALLGASREIEDAESELQMGRHAPDGTLTQAPAKPEDYVASWQARWQQAKDRALGGLKDPETRLAAERLLQRREIEGYGQARRTGNRLIIDHRTGVINEYERQFLQRAALDPSPEGREAWGRIYKAWIQTEAGILGHTEIQKRLTSFDQQVALYRANREIDQGTFSSGAYADILPPHVLGALEDRDIKRTEHREAQAREAYTRQKATVFSQIAQAADEGRFTKDDLRLYNESWHFSPAEQEAIRARIDRTADWESDRPTLTRWTVRVRSSQVREADRQQLGQLYLSKQLSRKDYEHLDAVAQQTINRREQDLREGLSERRFQFAQAEQSLGRSLRIRSQLFPDLENLGDEVLAVAQDELWQAYNRGEDPQVFYHRNLPRWIVMLGRGEERLRQLEEALPIKSLADLGTREQARARGMSEAEWERQSAVLLHIRELRKQLHGRLQRVGQPLPASPSTEPKRRPAPSGAPVNPEVGGPFPALLGRGINPEEP